MNVNTQVWFMEFASRTTILFAVVMILIKLQKLDQHLQFHFLKVLAVVALASGLDMIPYFGHYISVFVLLLGIKLVTDSSYTDVLFTVANFLRDHVCCEPFRYCTIHGQFAAFRQRCRKTRAIRPPHLGADCRNGT